MPRVLTQTFGVAGGFIEKDGKILLVHEAQGSDKGKWSHPAGWIDVGEDPLEAVRREVREETGFEFTPNFILGIYSLVRQDQQEVRGVTPHALKIIFLGSISKTVPDDLSEDVSETKWFTPEEIYAMDMNTLRDLDIKQMLKDYFAGKKFPLNVITHTICK